MANGSRESTPKIPIKRLIGDIYIKKYQREIDPFREIDDIRPDSPRGLDGIIYMSSSRILLGYFRIHFITPNFNTNFGLLGDSGRLDRRFLKS